MRADQRLLLGAGEEDIVAHAAELARQFTALHDYVGEVAERPRPARGDRRARLDGAVAYRALVRYDAYGEMSGRQSTSIALLDAKRSGLVLSSIHHRDQARLYAKQLYEGQAELELSPEEDEAVRLALEGDRRPAGPASARGRTTMRAGYLGPEGTFTHEALIGGRAAGDELELVPLPTIYDTVMAVHAGAGGARAGPDRELARGLGQRDARRAWRWRPRTSRSSARSCGRSSTA